jgi:hypothetical protein
LLLDPAINHWANVERPFGTHINKDVCNNEPFTVLEIFDDLFVCNNKGDALAWENCSPLGTANG